MTRPQPGHGLKIDAHQHFWRYDPGAYGWIDESLAALRRDFLPQDLEPELGRAGFDGSIAVQARQSLEETRWLLELADRHAFIFGVVGWVDLQAEDARAQLESVGRHPKLVGIRHIVQSEPDDRFLLRPEFCRGIALLQEQDLAYDILVYPRHLPVVVSFVERFPEQRFVLDHLAKPDVRGGEIRSWAAAIRRLAEAPHLACKLSGLVTEADWKSWTPEQLRPYLDVVFDCFGPERLLVGSDWPVCTVAGDYTRVMDVVLDYVERCGTGARAAVLGGNAARLWKLEERPR
jgi:L-fuconolactonase